MRFGEFRLAAETMHSSPLRVVTFAYDRDRYDTPYRNAALRLLQTLDRMGVACSVFEVELDGSDEAATWANVTLHKSIFFKFCLERFVEPILWVDADNAVLRNPCTWVPRENVDFAAFPRGQDFIRVTRGEFARIFYPGLLFFGQTAQGRRLANALAESASRAAQVSLAVTDDYILQEVMTTLGNELALAVLPSTLMGSAIKHGASGNVQEFRRKVLQHKAPNAVALNASAGSAQVSSIMDLHRSASRIAASRRQSGVWGEYVVAKSVSALLRVALVVAGRASLPGLRGKSFRSNYEPSLPRFDSDASRRGGISSARPRTSAQKLSVQWWRSGSAGNLGDELSPVIVRHLTGQDVSFAAEGKRLMAVGSILKFADSKTVVWGSGFASPDDMVDGYPTILAIRGPLTDEVLQRAGINASPVYGDPALLMPEVLASNYAADYAPRESEETLSAIIPHVNHFSRAEGEIQAIRLRRQQLFIDFRVRRFEDMVARLGEIAQARHIFSSSLHGIILAHAFGVPATWMELDENRYGRISGGRFKFNDYFASIGAEGVEPLCVTNLSELSVDMAQPVHLEPTRLAAIRQDLRRVLSAELFDG